MRNTVKKYGSDFLQTILYTDGQNVYDSAQAATAGSVLAGENHTLIAIIIAGVLYALAYYYERYDIAAIVFFMLAVGIAVDFYLNSYYH